MEAKTFTAPSTRTLSFTVVRPKTKDLYSGKKFDYNLQALRGFTAFLIVLHHVTGYYDYLDPVYAPGFLHVIQPHGVLRVLIFFVLSGYVIGITNKEKMTGLHIITYLKNRLVRLYPIYAIGLLFSLVVATTLYSFKTILSHFTFTQLIFSGIIEENAPIWSLQFEVLYFISFIVISFFNINPIILSLTAIIIGLCNYLAYPYINAPIITSYFFGLAFWSSGLIITKYFKKSRTETNYALLLSTIPLLLCLRKLNLFSIGLSKLSLIFFGQPIEFPDSVSWFERPITFTDLSFLPYSMMFILLFSGKEFRHKKLIINVLYLLPALALAYIANNAEQQDLFKLTMLFLLYGTSLMFYFNKSEKLSFIAEYINKGAIWLGGISYGVFIIHFPLLVLFKRLDFFSGSLTTFVVRFILYITLTVIFSFLLEKKLQPWIKQRL